MGSYYRRYVKDFASIVHPMVDLMKKRRKFLWTEICDTSFEAVKQVLDSFDFMGYPFNDRGEFILDVGAIQTLEKAEHYSRCKMATYE